MAAFVLLCFLLLLQALTFSGASALPGCPTYCGDLKVPFPFGLGVGTNCSINPSFDVHCNTSISPPKAYLNVSSTIIEIVNINGSQVQVKYPTLAVTCYDLQDPQRGMNVTNKSSIEIDLSSSPFTLSEDNWFVAVGCDDMMMIHGQTRDVVNFDNGPPMTLESDSFGGGCVSFCPDKTDGKGFCGGDGNGYSPGSGCCRTTVPKGTSVIETHLLNLQEDWRGGGRLFPCSYAFVGEPWIDQFSYRLDGLQNSTLFLNQNPNITSSSLMLDWKIGNEDCSQASKNSSTFSCQENTTCKDYNARVQGTQGYLCHCWRGYDGNPYLTDINECENVSTNDCETGSICTNTLGGYTCSCPNGYQGDGRKNGKGCYRLYTHQSKIINITIGLASGMGFLLLIAACIWSNKAFQKRKNKNLRYKFFKRNGGLLLQQQQEESGEGTLGKINIFSAKELAKATDHFNENRILGQGGHGTVYKGMLSDGSIVAIKKSKLIDEHQLEQFINEVVILSQINHRNVVKLLGCCLEIEVPLLVYEFVPNGTLSDLIHDGSTKFPLSWNMRLKIAADVAGALAYLHSASSIPIYHRDIKSSNILLDEKYVAKVCDFGTSRSISVDQTHVTTLVKGTFGYLDPEYFQSSQFNEKSDVYSFGVVLVEILTSQRAISFNRTQEERSLATRFLLSMETNNMDAILDSIVLEQGRRDEVIAVSRLAQTCLNLTRKMRPTMKEVATKLESVRMSQMPSTVVGKSQEPKLHETKAMLLRDMEYMWTASDNSASISSTDTHPLMLETL